MPEMVGDRACGQTEGCTLIVADQSDVHRIDRENTRTQNVGRAGD